MKLRNMAQAQKASRYKSSRAIRAWMQRRGEILLKDTAPGEETDLAMDELVRLSNRRRPDPIPQRTPAWADLEEIDQIYAEAQRLTAETGILYSVDHEIPLCGQLVTGLHVHTNLRVIPLRDNILKGNRWAP